MLYLALQTLPDSDRGLFIITNLLLSAAAVLLAWTPSLLVRHYIFKEPVPRWAGLLIAVVTALLGMVTSTLLTGGVYPGTYTVAAIFAYLTVTRRGKEVEA
jgi:hypothetical protein